MGLTKNMKRIGMAAHNERIEIRDQLEWQEAQARKRREEADRAEEQELMKRAIYRYGDAFIDWYDGPEVPDKGYARERIELIKGWIARQEAPNIGVTAPVLGYVQGHRVVWHTDDPPANYVAVWNDDHDVTRFEKTTAPGEGRGGQEAMKPAESILPQ